MLVKCWQAALLAAMMALTGHTARAEDAPAKDGCACCAACCKKEKCCNAKDCCKEGVCCKKNDKGKDCSCCKDKECCKNCPSCKGKDCCKNCECCQSKDCACCKSKECGKKSCKCCDANEANTGSLIFGVGINANSGMTGHIVVNERNFASCPTPCKQAKITAAGRPAIVIVMPHPPIPLCGACPFAPPCVIPHAPAIGYGVGMPHPLPPPPPMLTPPGLPVPAMTPPMMPPRTVALPLPPPQPAPMAACPYPMAVPCPVAAATNANSNVENCLSILGMVSDLCCSHSQPASLPAMCLSSLGMVLDLCSQNAAPAPMPRETGDRETFAAEILPPPPPAPAPPIVPCAIAAPVPQTDALEVRIAAKPYSDRLEMIVAESHMSCKKMTVKVGDSEITLSRLDGQVRVRGEDLKATADCVRTDRKDRLILEGDVHLRYRKDDQRASINAECIEVDLASGSVTIKPASYTPVGLEGDR